MTDPTDLPASLPPLETPPTPPAAPPLWNPNAAALWSLVFTPIFGALLHAKNWQALGEPAKAAQSRRWAWFNFAALVITAALGVLLPDVSWLDRLSQPLGLALLLSWWLLPGREQTHLVKTRYGTNYPHRSLWRPIGWAALALIGFVIAAGLFGFFVELFFVSSDGGGSPAGGYRL